MKKIILIGILVLVLVSGCVSSVESTHYFEDTGNKVDNKRLCDMLGKKNCDDNPRCVGYQVDVIVCDDGKCYC